MNGILLELIERDEKRIESSEKYLKRCLEKVVQAINKLTALQYARTQQMFWEWFGIFLFNKIKYDFYDGHVLNDFLNQVK